MAGRAFGHYAGHNGHTEADSQRLSCAFRPEDPDAERIGENAETGRRDLMQTTSGEFDRVIQWPQSGTPNAQTIRRLFATHPRNARHTGGSLSMGGLAIGTGKRIGARARFGQRPVGVMGYTSCDDLVEVVPGELHRGGAEFCHARQLIVIGVVNGIVLAIVVHRDLRVGHGERVGPSSGYSIVYG